MGADAQRLPIILRSTTLCKERRQLQGVSKGILFDFRVLHQALDQASDGRGKLWREIEPSSFAIEIQISLDLLPKVGASLDQLHNKRFRLSRHFAGSPHLVGRTTGAISIM
jgi:hypothetical protein